MKREVEQPKVRIDNSNVGGRVFTHPAYAVIGASRISGTRDLFGSNINHHGFVRIKIMAASLRRDDKLAHDWIHGGDTIIEVDMSEAQWVSFISRMNMSADTPVTINCAHTEGFDFMPYLPPQESAEDRLGTLVDDKVKSNIRHVNKMKDEVLKLIEGMPVRKREEVTRAVEMMAQHLLSNHEYAGKRLTEWKEGLVKDAKIEINAVVAGTLQMLGIDSLQQLSNAGAEAQQRVAERLPSIEHKGEE